MKSFDRWARKANLSDKALQEAVQEMEKGIIHADLGGSVYKQRIPLPERGKRGSTRVVIAACLGTRYFFLYGFEKNEKDNISRDELKMLRILAESYLSYTNEQIEFAIKNKKIREVEYHEQTC